MSDYNRKVEDSHYSAVFAVYEPANPTAIFELTFKGISLTSFSTNITPQWSPEKAGGRADPLYRYEQFSREVNLSFDLIAYNPIDHDHNYRDLNKLAASTMPVYDKSGNNGNGYNGCLVKVKIGSLVKPLLQGYAIITNLNYSWDDKYPWKVADNTVMNTPPSYGTKRLWKNQPAPAGTSVTLALTMLGKNDNTRYRFDPSAADDRTNNLFNVIIFE